MGSTGWGHRKLILEPNTVAVRRAKMAFFLQVKLVYVHVSKKNSPTKFHNMSQEILQANWSIYDWAQVSPDKVDSEEN